MTMDEVSNDKDKSGVKPRRPKVIRLSEDEIRWDLTASTGNWPSYNTTKLNDYGR